MTSQRIADTHANSTLRERAVARRLSARQHMDAPTLDWITSVRPHFTATIPRWAPGLAFDLMAASEQAVLGGATATHALDRARAVVGDR